VLENFASDGSHWTTAAERDAQDRGAAGICSTTPKTVKSVIEAQERIGDLPAVAHNYDEVRELVAARVKKTKARISAKRLLPAARVAGYSGSPRNFRRLVADEKAAWRADNHRGPRPGVWEPGDMLVIDWGAIGAAARLLRRVGLQPGALRLVFQQRAIRDDARVPGPVLGVPGRRAEDRARRSHGVSQGPGARFDRLKELNRGNS
jgi:hypothetical protein